MPDPTPEKVDEPIVEEVVDETQEQEPELEIEHEPEKPKTAEEKDAELAAAISDALAPEIPKEEAEVDEQGKPKRDPVTGKFLPKEKAEVKPDGEKPKEGTIDPKTGKPVAKVDVIDPKTGKPVAKEPVKEPDKKPDPINDPIEKGVSERTTARIHSLIEIARTAQAKADESTQLFQHIADTGTSPENFGHTISYLRLFNSPHRADNEKAFEIMGAEYRALAIKLGKTEAGVDVLAEHPDLKEKVRLGHIQEADAKEIALARLRDAENTRATSATATAAETQRNFETAKAAAINELNVLGNQMSKDPEYGRKYAILVPALRPVFERLHPSQWKEAFQSAYANLKLPAAPSALPALPAKPKGVPLRPKAPSGQGAKQAGSLEEAIQAGLDEASA